MSGETTSRTFRLRMEGLDVRHRSESEVVLRNPDGSPRMYGNYKGGIDFKLFFTLKIPESSMVAECKWDNDLNFRHREIGLVVRHDHSIGGDWSPFVSNYARALKDFHGTRCDVKLKPDNVATNRELTNNRGEPIAETADTRHWFLPHMQLRFKDGGVSFLERVSFKSKLAFRDLGGLRIEGSGFVAVMNLKNLL